MEQLPLTAREKKKLYRQSYRVKKLLEQTGRDSCHICDLELKPGLRFVVHHLAYKEEPGVTNDVVTLLCHACHLWLHGNGRVYSNAIKDMNSKSSAPLVFAKRVVKMYEDCGIWHQYHKVPLKEC